MTRPPITISPGLKNDTRPASTWPTCRPLSRISCTAWASPWDDRQADVGGGELAVLLEERRERRGPAGPGRGGGVAGERGAAGERLEAAGVAAGAGRAEVLDPDVPDVAGAAVDAAVELAVDDDAAADAGADLHEQEVRAPLATPACCSPTASTFTSLSSTTGQPSSRETASRTG